MTKNKHFIHLLLVALLCFALLGGCVSDDIPAPIDGETSTAAPEPSQNGEVGGEQTDEEIFDILIDELFLDWVTEDTLSLRFFYADPIAAGIEPPETTYGRVMTPEIFEEERAQTNEIADRLADIRYDALSRDKQIIYDIVSRNIELSKTLEEKEDFTYYTGYIRPLTGLQAQLPTLLAEFKFYTAEDIETYLDLLGDTIRYFDDIIEFERERAARGFFMSDDNLDTVIEQLESFLEHRDDNFLITIQNDKIDQFPGLSEQQREDYKKRNGELVLENVLVAFDNLLDAMRSLKGVGAHPGGLADLPDGERYAHASLSLRAGTDRSAFDLEAMVNRWKTQALYNARAILYSNEDIMDKYVNDTAGRIPGATAEEYLSALQNAMSVDFPPIYTIDYEVLEVHESLSDFLSPAFFLVPTADRYDENVIYINPGRIGSSADDNLSFFTTLAHEGYPGHMYQMVYFRQSSPHPIRLMLANTGYTEGWATYAEHISYDYAGLSALEAELMRENDLYFLLLHAHVDIGVNLLGWNIDDVAEVLLDDLGITEPEAARSYYDSVTGVPLNPSMYALGYIEMSMLREEAEGRLGFDFNLFDFHRDVLEFGPAPFDLIRRELIIPNS